MKKFLLLTFAALFITAQAFAYTDRNVPDHVGDTADMDDSVSIVIGAQADTADLDGLFTSRDQTNKIYYNQYDDSGTAWGTTTAAITMTNAAVQLGDHMYQSTKPFYSQAANTYYEWIVYFLSRPSTCDGVMEGGFIYVSYSSNFTTWTTPELVQGTPAAGLKAWDCAGGNTGIAAAGVGTFLRHGTIYLVYSQGEMSVLESIGAGTHTNLVMITSTPGRSGFFTHPMSVAGVAASSATQAANLAGLFDPAFDQLIQPAVFRRIGVSYDPVTGELWIARAYAWPAGTNFGVPCAQVGCKNGVQLQTSRVQIITIQVGNPVKPAMFYNGAVMTRADWGSAAGYGMERGGSCEHPALQPGMTDLNSADDDIAFASFQRDLNGTLNSNLMAWLAVMPTQDRTDTTRDCTDSADVDIFDHSLP